jgi:glucosamine kinase
MGACSGMRARSLVELPEALTTPSKPAHGTFILGVDGGATKTVAAVLNLETKKLCLPADGGPSNAAIIGIEQAVGVVLRVADEAMEKAGISRREIARAVLAVAGPSTEMLACHVRAVRSEDWIVVNDVVAAWATATRGTPGVGAISGTGSNVFGVGPGGRAWRAGGWGHLLGDEGSGYWLGIETIRAALHERDGTGSPTALSAAATEFFGVESVEAVAALVYSKPLTKGEIAAIAPRTAALAASGDEVARSLYERAAAELGRQIAVVIERTGLHDVSPDAGFPVGLIGSVFKAGAVFVEPLRAVIREAAPRARVSVTEMAPVGGSLLLAARACGLELPPDTLSQLSA